jgi:hypothetical protein
MSPLRQRMIEDMQIRNLTLNTQRVYAGNAIEFWPRSADQFWPIPCP